MTRGFEPAVPPYAKYGFHIGAKAVWRIDPLITARDVGTVSTLTRRGPLHQSLMSDQWLVDLDVLDSTLAQSKLDSLS